MICVEENEIESLIYSNSITGVENSVKIYFEDGYLKSSKCNCFKTKVNQKKLNFIVFFLDLW